nr:hypothetical protein [Tanacetum cinerariifolium]
KFVSSITESKELQEEDITSDEAEIVFGSTTQIGNFVKAIKFVSGITESKELQEEDITSDEPEIVFGNPDTRGRYAHNRHHCLRSACNRRPCLVTVKRQVCGKLFREADMPPKELLSMFTEMAGAREIETRKSVQVNKLNGMNNDLDEAQRAGKEMLNKILRKEGKIYNDWNAEVSRLERLYVASKYMKAGDGAAEDTYKISIDIKRANEDLYDQLKNVVLQKFILKLKWKGIVVREEALLMFHLEYHDEETNLLKAEFIQVGSQ